MHPDNPSFTIDVYGPPHLTSMVLSVWTYTHSFAECNVHFYELLSNGEELDISNSFSSSYHCYVDGIYPDPDGYWTCFSVFH